MAIYFVIGLIGVAHHAPWSDEYQPWLEAIGSNSLGDLYRNTQYEPHPMLWYIFLFLLTRIWQDPLAMQVFNFLIAVGFVYLFLRYSPFSIFQKTLFVFGYFVIFEYSMIARHYAIEIFLVFLFCVLYKKRRNNIFWISLVLFLLANCSPFALAISFCLFVVLISDHFLNQKKHEWSKTSTSKILLISLIYFLGFALSCAKIVPSQGSTLYRTNLSPSLQSLTDLTRLKITAVRLVDAYFPFQEMSLLPEWDEQYFQNGLPGYPWRPFGDGSSLFFLFIFIGCLIHLRKPFVLAFYLLTTLGLMLVYQFIAVWSIRYTGYLYFVFIISLWIAENYQETIFHSSSIFKFSEWGKKIQKPFIVLVLLMQAAAGFSIYMTSLTKPFSESRLVAKFIQDQGLDRLPIVGTFDYAVPGFSALLHKPIFYPEIGDYGTFVINNSRRDTNRTISQGLRAFETVLSNGQNSALLILNGTRHTGGPQKDQMIGKDIRMHWLTSFEGGMVPDEQYSLFLIQRVAVGS
jgi:hypothetical protein